MLCPPAVQLGEDDAVQAVLPAGQVHLNLDEIAVDAERRAGKDFG